MSRSKRGGKSPGYEYWSKRPCSTMGHGKDVKQMTKEKERMASKQELQRELNTTPKEN